MKTNRTTRLLQAVTRPVRRATKRLRAFNARYALRWLLLLTMLAQGTYAPLAVTLAAKERRPAGAASSSGAGVVRRRVTAQATQTFTVYGPRRFERQAGAPVNVTERFTLPADAVAPFTVQLQNGAPDGAKRVSSATVKLNGSELFIPGDFNQSVGSLSRGVTLAATNTLEVRLTSAVGSFISISVTATRAQTLPASLAAVEPGRATQGQALSVTLRGHNTHWVAGQTRASFGGEISVGGAAPGEPGPVTVTDATTAVADLNVSATAALAPRAARVVTPVPGAADVEDVSLANALVVTSASAPGSAASRVTTLAGLAGAAGYADGAAGQARFNNLSGIAAGADDSVYVADAGNHRIRVVRSQPTATGAPAYAVSTLAGSGTPGFTDGSAATAQFNNPQGVAVDAGGTVYVADTDNHRVRRISPDGQVSTVAGDGTPGFSDGAGAQARFNSPRGVALDQVGNIYVADTGNSAVRKISAAGEVSTLAGDGTVGSTDSPRARFDGLMGIASDGEHILLYLADTGNHRIRRLDAAGTVINIAGAERGFADGSASQARFAEPSGIDLDGSGKIIIADAVNSLVRAVDPSLAASGSPQAVTTLAGTGERGSTDGAGDVARFFTPRGLVVMSSSAVVVADTGSHTLRRILLPPVVNALSPASARPGDQINILGERFDGRAPERNTVRFVRAAAAGGGQTAARVVSATRNVLTVEVPSDVADGPVTVETEGGAASSPVDFELAPLPAPVITDFDPKKGPVGITVTLVGTGLRPDAGTPLVTFTGESGARLPALVTDSSQTEVRVVVPNGARTGSIELTNAAGRANTPAPFTVASEQDFELTVAPSTATAVQGGTATYIVSLTSGQTSFTQMARLSLTGLPAGVKATFDPAQITAGAQSTLSLNLAGAGLAPGSYPFTINAAADVAGRELTRAVGATLNVLAGGQTTLSGRVMSSEGDPIMGATVSLDGRTATTDAAGAFILSGITAGQARPLMIDGRTANAPNRTYPVILEPADVVAGQANVIPYIFYLPPIDTQYEVEVVPGQETRAGNPRVPGLVMSVPAGANLRNRDNSPVTRVSITPLPIDRTPTPLPSNVSTAIVYTSQPGGALTDIPIPVTYPNLMDAAPGTRMELYAFNHDTVRWYVYGYGRVSADGRTISPEINPATGRPYGLVDFSWHFPASAPDGDPNDPGGCGRGGHPVDFSTGAKIESATDISYGGVRGGLSLTRTFTNDLARTAFFGRFGRGTKDNFDVRLVGTFQAGGAGRVVMPEELTGRLFSYVRTDADGALVFSSRATAGHLGDVVRKLTDGTFQYRFADGVVWNFDSSGRLTAMADRNGNVATLTYTGANLTRITDPVGRSITLDYDGSGRVVTATDPAGQKWRYGYGDFGIVSNVTDPLGHITRYTFTPTIQLAAVIDGRGNFVKQLKYDGSGRVVEQTFADGGTERYAYAMSGGVITATTITDALGRTEVKRFNANGYLIGETDALGQTSRIERDIVTNLPLSVVGPCGCPEETRQFDDRGNVVAVMDRLGQTQRYEYDPVFNKPTRIADKLGRATTYAYDARGNLASITDALNQTTTFVYDSSGQLLSVTDPLGHASHMEYDAQGNMTARVDALGHRVTFEYDAVGRMTAFVDELGRRSGKTYDAEGRVSSVIAPNGAVTRFAYDENDNLVGRTDALKQTWTSAYDAKNRRVSTTDPLGQTQKLQYDLDDELSAVTSPSGRTRSYTYDARGQVQASSDSLAGVVRYNYDSRRNLVSVVDQRGSTTTFTYDELLRPIGVRDPLGNASTISYDAVGNITGRTDRLGRRTVIEYDALNRVTRRTYADATVTYSFDAANRVTRVEDTQAGFVQWAYDDANRLLSETTPAGAVSYDYNEAGQRTSLNVAGRDAVGYEYDAAGRLSAISQAGERFDFGYDELSRRKSLARPNGVSTTYAYDADNRLARITHAQNQVLEDFQYSFNADNELVAVTSLFAGQQLPAPREASAADPANRVTQFGGSSFSFDAEGRITSKVEAGGSTQYQWDARGRLTQVTLADGRSVSYGYDALGRLTHRAVGGGAATDFIYDGLDVVLDRGSDGSAVDYLNSLGVDEKLRQKSAGTGALYFLQDHLGSTSALTDAAGNVLERVQYGPFGEGSGSQLTRYDYAGRERDAATGLMYNRARWLDTQQGRFMSEDPSGFRGGLNLYAYVENNPLSFVDPSGLDGTIKLPSDPSGLGPEWTHDPTHRDPNGSRWRGPGDEYLDFHKGRPGAKGWRGKDHWHHNGGDEHLKPGDEIEVPEPGGSCKAPEPNPAPAPAPAPEPEPDKSLLDRAGDLFNDHPYLVGGAIIVGIVVVGVVVVGTGGGAAAAGGLALAF